MEKWYAVYDKNTNKLVSTGTVIEAEKLPGHLVVVELPEMPDFSVVQWDTTSHIMKPQVEKPPTVVELSPLEVKVNDLLEIVKAIQTKVGA